MIVDAHVHLQPHGEAPPVDRALIESYVAQAQRNGVDVVVFTEHLFRFKEAFRIEPRRLLAVAHRGLAIRQDAALGVFGPEREIEALFPLIRLRLAVSVTNSAHLKTLHPDDPNVTVSESRAWDALRAFAKLPPRLAHYTLRHACGLPPVPHAPS